jgi:hypothetical protein
MPPGRLHCPEELSLAPFYYYYTLMRKQKQRFGLVIDLSHRFSFFPPACWDLLGLDDFGYTWRFLLYLDTYSIYPFLTILSDCSAIVQRLFSETFILD